MTEPIDDTHPAPGSDSSIDESALSPGGRSPNRSRWSVVPFAIALGVVAIVVVGQALAHRADAETNHVALSANAKGVTVADAVAATFRPTRRYVGSIDPWIEARVGSQLVSAYVSTVTVRPGAVVRRGDVLATLDCRAAIVESSTVALQARAIEARQSALATQATRVAGLLDGGFVAANEVDQRRAESQSEQASLQATRARLVGTNLNVGDCVLRAPFDGEIGARMIDPGAFIHPGSAIVTEVDRGTVRIVSDVPETDFNVVAPATPVRIRLVATDREIVGAVTRRSPAADEGTRTIHIEIDIADPARAMPVNTTAEIFVDVGSPVPATMIPLIGADVRGSRASVFVVQNGVAHARTVRVIGEAAGGLFVDPTLAAGTQVVTEGRSMLTDGDRVAATRATPTPVPVPAVAPSTGGHR